VRVGDKTNVRHGRFPNLSFSYYLPNGRSAFVGVVSYGGYPNLEFVDTRLNHCRTVNTDNTGNIVEVLFPVESGT